jgi:hypothetical protein
MNAPTAVPKSRGCLGRATRAAWVGFLALLILLAAANSLLAAETSGTAPRSNEIATPFGSRSAGYRYCLALDGCDAAFQWFDPVDPSAPPLTAEAIGKHLAASGWTISPDGRSYRESDWRGEVIATVGVTSPFFGGGSFQPIPSDHILVQLVYADDGRRHDRVILAIVWLVALTPTVLTIVFLRWRTRRRLGLGG